MGATFAVEQLTPGDVTPVLLTDAKITSGGKTAQKVFITVTGADARMKVGEAPTATSGLLLKITADKPYEFSGFDFIDDAQFISTASGGSVIDVQIVRL